MLKTNKQKKLKLSHTVELWQKAEGKKHKIAEHGQLFT